MRSSAKESRVEVKELSYTRERVDDCFKVGARVAGDRSLPAFQAILAKRTRQEECRLTGAAFRIRSGNRIFCDAFPDRECRCEPCLFVTR